MASCGWLVTGHFRIAEGVRRLTTVAQLAKLPHKYRAHIAQDLRRTTLSVAPIVIA
jgi:hypothetical protein